MSKTPRKYTEEFRTDAIALIERSDRSHHQLAKDLGISVHTLKYWWLNRMKRKKKSPLPSQIGPQTETAEQIIERQAREIAALKRTNAQLEMDREILKKAAAFFAKESE